MTPPKTYSHKIMLVDDDDAVRAVMSAIPQRKGFEVVAVASVTEALRFITTEKFEVLITELHMPNPGDGFTVISAMRHSQPEALTLLISGYPDVQSAMSAILLEADEIICKPFEFGRFAELVRGKMRARKPAVRVEKEREGEILRRCIASVVEDCLARVKQAGELKHLPLNDDNRTGHLPTLIEDLVVRLGKAQRHRKRQRCRFVRSRRGPWQAAISTRVYTRDVGARITNPPSGFFRNSAEQSKRSGF
jgi:DNA-binding response OmpR family regulator